MFYAMLNTGQPLCDLMNANWILLMQSISIKSKSSNNQILQYSYNNNSSSVSNWCTVGNQYLHRDTEWRGRGEN